MTKTHDEGKAFGYFSLIVPAGRLESRNRATYNKHDNLIKLVKEVILHKKAA